MTCLCCQKQFEDHDKHELIKCIEWIQDIHHIRSEQIRKIAERVEYLKKHGENIYTGVITLHDIIRELEEGID